LDGKIMIEMKDENIIPNEMIFPRTPFFLFPEFEIFGIEDEPGLGRGCISAGHEKGLDSNQPLP
jgi:hypothetical protein